MSHHTLQALIVRMLFDDSFASAVYAQPAQTLAGLALTADEQAQLLAIDRRAWRHDALRTRRTLRTLVEEFKISTTIILAETRSLASLEQFFASAFFHQAVQQRGSLGLSFAEFMLASCKPANDNSASDSSKSCWAAARFQAPQLPDVIRLEAALANCRRHLARTPAAAARDLPSALNESMRVQLAPGCGVGAFQANVVPTIQHVEKYLFELSLMPAAALCDDAPRLTDLPEVAATKKEYLLFSPGATGLTLTQIDKPTYLVLYETKRPVELRAVFARLKTSVKLEQAQTLIVEWLENGALQLL